jgi:hypothetical protein
METRAPASPYLVRALIYVDTPIDAKLAQSWANSIQADEIIALTSADQDDMLIGSVKVAGREPKFQARETLTTHVTRALSARLGSLPKVTKGKSLLARIAWFRPDHIYSNVRAVEAIGKRIGVSVYPLI